MSLLTGLECPRCGHRQEATKPVNTCSKCQGPYFARYDLEAAKEVIKHDAFASRVSSMWRYKEVLPVKDERHIVSLGEGSTPLLHASRLGDEYGMTSLLIKDEGQNPTGTFKARGLSAAVSKNKELGVTKFAIPTAGNAGGALSTYAAAAGCKAFVACPRETPLPHHIKVHVTGGTVRLVDGTIADAAALVKERVAEEGYFDVSTLKEPYRLEGKKTMGYELAEALGWNVPDVIIYPTGGGTGLIGIWKAFEELEEIGLIGSRRPRMVAVQAAGCAPIVRAYAAKQEESRVWEKAATLASGLRVPKPFADQEILMVIKASSGTAVSVTDDEILRAAWKLAGLEGVFAAPEGAATVAGLQALREDGWLEPKETVVLLNTGNGLKYTDLFTRDPPKPRHDEYDAHDH